MLDQYAFSDYPIRDYPIRFDPDSNLPFVVVVTLRHNLCLACKRKLPEDYEYSYCCGGDGCSCLWSAYGLPLEPWFCCRTCYDIAINYNWMHYRYMWE